MRQLNFFKVLLPVFFLLSVFSGQAWAQTPPTITSSAPTTATEDTLYSFTATVSDPDGPGAIWSVLGGSTCGGSFAGAVYSFTPTGPTPPASCNVVIQVCDGGSPDLCDTQTTTVTITADNDLPAIASSAPTTAVTSVLYSYTPIVSDPDGPDVLLSVIAGDTCGGTFSSGTYSFTPGAAGSCYISIQACDGGAPEECDTEELATVTITDSQALVGHNYDVNGGVTLDCNTCHAFHGGTMIPTADEVFTACTQCHNSTGGGAINSNKWDVSNHTVTGEVDPAPRTVDCGQCHEVHMYALLSDASELEPGGGSARNIAYIRVKMSKYITGALDNTVFQEDPNHLAEYENTGVGTTLNGVCQSCHTDTKFHKNTEIASNHKMSAGGPPNTTDCTACHQHGSGDEGTNATGGSFAATGGHGSNHFGWGGNCDDCHSASPGSPAESVVTDIHGDKCDLCHIGGIYDDTSNGAGPVANGIDGDASLAEGSAAAGFPATYNCITCHVIAGAVNATSIGGIHHDNNTDGVVSTDANCTSKCHNVSGHKGGHDVNIADTTNCNTCHTTSDDGTGGALVDSADAKVHDGCMVSCHDIASTPGASGLLQVVSAPGKSSPIATGDCNGCHSSYFVNHNHHTLATNKVVAIGNCSSCHDGSAGGSARDGITSPFVVSGEVHNATAGGDGCAACHNIINGAFVSLASSADATIDGNAANYSCRDCHTTGANTWTTIHDGASGIDHSQEVANLPTCTNSCHDATGNHGAGDIASLVDATPNNKVHDYCSDCHDADGARKAVTAPGGSGNIPVGGGDCGACHSATYFYSHNHHETASNKVSDDSDVDRSQNSDVAANACAECHTDATCDNTSLNTWNGIRLEHDINDGSKADGTGGCDTCHDYVTLGNQTGAVNTPLLSTVETTIAAGAATTCITCHVPKDHTSGASASHGTVDHTAKGYVTFVGSVPGCDSCHVPGAIDATIGVHLSCQSCHTCSPPQLRTDYGAMKYVPLMPAGGGTCEDCHYGHQVGEETDVDVAQLPKQMCGECHGGLDHEFTDFSEIKMHHYNDCATCHDSIRDINDPNDSVTDWTESGYTVADVIANGGILNVSGIPDDTTGPTNCTNCHRGKMGLDHTGHPKIKAGIRGSKYSDDAVGQQTLTCFASGCHAENTVEEHLTPRGVAYKNYKYKYSSAFDCEFCHQYKYPVEMIKDVNGCSDPAFSNKTDCENGTPTWSTIVRECSDPAFTDQSSCETGDPVWHEPLTFNDDPVIQAAIVNGLNGNDVYCSDCHKEDVGRHDFGECSDGVTQNDVECELSCSNPLYTTQVDCLTNGGTWDVSTGETWIWAGYCDNPAYENEADCIGNGGTWKQSVPYSMHEKYNGLGIYDISEHHHVAEEYTGTCSNAGISDETACWDAGETWTPSYSPGVTYVGNGDCTACHLDPREVNGLPAPKKLPCIDCHVDNDVAGDQVTVYKSRTYTQSTLSEASYTGWSWAFTGNIANTDPIGLTGTSHQWSVNGGDIQNYGACVFCHKMRPYHAKSDPSSSGITFSTNASGTDTDCSDGACDREHFPGVGRNNLNVFFGVWRAPVKFYISIGAGAPSSNQTKKDLAKVAEIDAVPKVHPIYWQKVTYDPLTDPHGQVPADHQLDECSDPAYKDQASCEGASETWTARVPEYFMIPIFDTPSGSGGDSVSINTTNSFYTPGATPTLTVQATCSGTCSEVFVVFGGKEYSMGTGSGTYTKVLTSAEGVLNTQPKNNPGFTDDTIMGRVYVVSVDTNGNTTDQAAIDFKEYNVRTSVTYP